MAIQFDENGYMRGYIPAAAVSECTAGGIDATPFVKAWIEKLNFRVPRQKAIDYLREFGAWDIEELQASDDDGLAEKVFWIACGDIKENGAWHGLIH